ncbi:MAG: hypothetical protein IIY04_02580 [Oscillospiraceae bacterium]|nr:hypothetical protein [Oscillospiraceae bacterium]
MWLSKKAVRAEEERDAATLGTVSIGGSDAAVVTDGAMRNARLITPGGYCWQPSAADSVLVIKGNELYVPGVLQQAAELEPGEILIFSDAASVRLKNDGKIEIDGRVFVTGNLFVNGKRVLTE